MVDVLIKILPRKHLGIGQTYFKSQRFPGRIKPMRMIMKVKKSLPLPRKMFFRGAMIDVRCIHTHFNYHPTFNLGPICTRTHLRMRTCSFLPTHTRTRTPVQSVSSLRLINTSSLTVGESLNKLRVRQWRC